MFRFCFLFFVFFKQCLTSNIDVSILQKRYIIPAKTLIDHLDLRLSAKKALDLSRKAYQDYKTKTAATMVKVCKKADPKDCARAYKLMIDSTRAERKYLYQLDVTQEIYIHMRLVMEMEMTHLVMTLARGLVPLNKTKLDATMAFTRKMQESKVWAGEQREVHKYNTEETARQAAEAAIVKENCKYDPLVSVLSKRELCAAIGELSNRPEMGTVQRVILPHIYRVMTAHQLSTSALESSMQREFIQYAQQESVSKESVFQTELPSIANFLKANYLDIASTVQLQTQRDLILELANVLGQLFSKR